MKIEKGEFYTFLQSMIGLEINDDTRFFESVGMDGLDAEQMMIQIAHKYDIKLSEYDPAIYHLSEGEMTNFLLPLWHIIIGKTIRHSSFTALHLFHVLQAGKWFSPPV